jgi:hypothetical protein
MGNTNDMNIKSQDMVSLRQSEMVITFVSSISLSGFEHGIDRSRQLTIQTGKTSDGQKRGCLSKTVALWDHYDDTVVPI